MYGANIPGFTFADMLDRLRRDGVLPYRLAAVSPGGVEDAGARRPVRRRRPTRCSPRRGASACRWSRAIRSPRASRPGSASTTRRPAAGRSAASSTPAARRPRGAPPTRRCRCRTASSRRWPAVPIVADAGPRLRVRRARRAGRAPAVRPRPGPRQSRPVRSRSAPAGRRGRRVLREVRPQRAAPWGDDDETRFVASRSRRRLWSPGSVSCPAAAVVGCGAREGSAPAAHHERRPGARRQDVAPAGAAVQGVVTDFDYIAEPTVADLQKKPYKTMFVVLGSTAKGLGASGITIDQEIERLTAMIAEAKKQKIQIVAILLEGKTRRGKPGGADERCIDAIAPFAHYLVVKKDGNEDGRFDAIAKKSGAPLTLIDDAIDFTEVVEEDVRRSEHLRRHVLHAGGDGGHLRPLQLAAAFARTVDGDHGGRRGARGRARLPGAPASSRGPSPSSTSPSSSSRPACS